MCETQTNERSPFEGGGERKNEEIANINAGAVDEKV